MRADSRDDREAAREALFHPHGRPLGKRRKWEGHATVVNDLDLQLGLAGLLQDVRAPLDHGDLLTFVGREVDHLCPLRRSPEDGLEDDEGNDHARVELGKQWKPLSICPKESSHERTSVSNRQGNRPGTVVHITT